jgi:hypothetical protein
MKEMDEYNQRRKKEELQKTKERIKKRATGKAKKEYLESNVARSRNFKEQDLRFDIKPT